MDSRTMRAYDCDAQYPENPVLRCSLDANHNGKHEAWTDDTPHAPRLLASWDRDDEDGAPDHAFSEGVAGCQVWRLGWARCSDPEAHFAEGHGKGIAAGLAAFNHATLHRPYIMPRVTR